MERGDYTVVGVISATRSDFTGDKAAIADAGNGKKADVMRNVPCSRLLGYLPTRTEGFYLAVRKSFLLPLILLPLLLLALLLLCLLRPPFNPQGTPADTPPDVVPGLETNVNDGKTADEIMEEKVGVTLPGWTQFAIAADTKNVQVNFYNPSENKGYYYLTFELLLENGDEYESLYQSGLVEPGMHVTDIELNRALPAGEYDAVVHMQPYTMSTPPEETNAGDVRIKLIVS